MQFNGIPIPSSLVQIIDITHKDGTPLEPDNWRRERIGLVTMCWLAGGFRRLTPFFKGAIWLENNIVTSIDLSWSGNASTGCSFAEEVEPGIFDFTTNTSIYRFRLLDETEVAMVSAAIDAEIKNMLAQCTMIMKGPDTRGFPAS